jgi:hypothetical protein
VYVGTVDISGAIQKQVVFTYSEEDREVLMKEIDGERRLALEPEVEQAMGFRHVIDLIASGGKVIIGHNCIWLISIANLLLPCHKLWLNLLLLSTSSFRTLLIQSTFLSQHQPYNL